MPLLIGNRDGGGGGGLRSNRDREWPGVCCWGGNVADVKSGDGVGGDDTGRGRLARVTLKNDVCPPGREWECAHTGAATIFQTNHVTLVSFARCRRVAVQTPALLRILSEFYPSFQQIDHENRGLFSFE